MALVPLKENLQRPLPRPSQLPGYRLHRRVTVSTLVIQSVVIGGLLVGGYFYKQHKDVVPKNAPAQTAQVSEAPAWTPDYGATFAKHDILNAGGVIDLGKFKVKLSDVGPAVGPNNLHPALIEILSPKDSVLEQFQDYSGDTRYCTDVPMPGHRIQVHIYCTVPGATANAKSAEIGVAIETPAGYSACLDSTARRILAFMDNSSEFDHSWTFEYGELTRHYHTSNKTEAQALIRNYLSGGERNPSHMTLAQFDSLYAPLRFQGSNYGWTQIGNVYLAIQKEQDPDYRADMQAFEKRTLLHSTATPYSRALDSLAMQAGKQVDSIVTNMRESHENTKRLMDNLAARTGKPAPSMAMLDQSWDKFAQTMVNASEELRPYLTGQSKNPPTLTAARFERLKAELQMRTKFYGQMAKATALLQNIGSGELSKPNP